MKTAKEWNKQFAWTTDSNTYIIKQIRTEAWNEAIEAAAENANVVSTNGEFETIHDSVNGIKVNKQSILKLKK